MSLKCFVPAVCVAANSTFDGKPEALTRAQQSRDQQNIATARVEFVSRNSDPRFYKSKATRYYTWKCAQDRYISVDRGDEHGVAHRDQDGQPTKATYNGPDSWFVKDGEAWRRQEGTLYADVFQKGDEMTALWDLRKSGLRADIRDDDDFEEDATKFGYEIHWSTKTDGELHIVTGKVEGSSVEWWIDPAKDWGVIRTVLYLNEKKVDETRYELALFDGVWFPKRIEEFHFAAGSPAEPVTVIDTLSAEFNRPEHPQTLAPADIGVEVGMTITAHERGGRATGIAYWDGQKAISLSELDARRKSGELTMGPAIARRADQIRSLREAVAGSTQADQNPVSKRPGLAKAHVESEWEAYTRRFIDTHQLDKEQTTRALSILKACQDRAWEYVSKHAAEFDELERLAEKTVADKPAVDGRPATQPSRELQERRTKLLQPIIAIFDNELKPRLDRLPTRAQHETAKQRGWPAPHAAEAKKP